MGPSFPTSSSSVPSATAISGPPGMVHRLASSFLDLPEGNFLGISSQQMSRDGLCPILDKLLETCLYGVMHFSTVQLGDSSLFLGGGC